MAYLGKTPSQAVRQRYIFTQASAGATSISGADDNGNTLSYTDGGYVDVYLNGVLLVAGTDYNTTTANTIGGLTALSASDVVEIVVYDVFSVFGGDVQGDLTISNGDLTVDTDAENVVRIRSADGTIAGILFGDQSDSSRGSIYYDNSDESTQFRVNNQQEAMRIDSSGNLLVGRTSVGGTGSGHSIRGGDSAIFSRDASGETVQIGRNSSDGQLVRFNSNGSAIGYIGVVDGNDTYITGDNTAIRLGLGSSGAYVSPCNSDGSVRDGVIRLGDSSARWRDLYLSGGVYVGGTGSANYLDDYEQGTWTPQVLGSTSGTTTYTNQTASYVKVGNMVSVSGYVAWSAATGTGTMRIYGLPFTTGSTLHYLAAGSVFMNNIDIPTGYLTPVMYAENNKTYLVIYYTRDNATWQVAQMDSAGGLIFQITYNTNA